ncbi:N-acetylmuramoyl-L-alanine amidase [Thermobifida cellulosilytica]|uniref:Hint domain-containing protein n=1 Tax=Thermobifida cellulosilytica TB100 TaxID=665004 RepID=A0A147KDP5_THECS|nr:N-acetylmuramoyl-L-alanine amidase [Thermobifida cellulosilytica]KUP95414.1 hypothetical protein AC529_17780 [Thermobifida cellulosilytica TB100]
MPKPERFVSRSDLGWGASGGSYANPRQGLVIHYDGSNQNLANRDHSACVAYWRNTRSFHTGPSRGWADIGYCVDERTEILTSTGWRTFREVRPGDTVLTLNHRTGLAEWQPLLDVYVFPAQPRTMIRMEGRTHSSLTTPQHRWPVEHAHRRADAEHTRSPDRARPAASRSTQGWEWNWATTETLTHRDRIPLAAPCADLPAEPKWSDALVELAAWLWPGLPDDPEDHDGRGADVPLRPRERAQAARLRAALHGLFGPPTDPASRTDLPADRRTEWQERSDGPRTEFRLSAEAARTLLQHLPGGAPTPAFLRSLTRAQLDLFVETSLLAGSTTGRTGARRSLVHRGRARAEAFQFAAILAGHATTLRRLPAAAPDRADTWRVDLHPGTGFAPRAAASGTGSFTIAEERYYGHVWCVRTPNATWLARRRGTVYFTGNSFGACPHGYVFEGRGLYRSQAAQPGGNSTYYSVTLMSGPTDTITDAQINAVRQLREWLMEPETSIGSTVKGHRDFISTSCPGDRLYRMVRDGVFNQPAQWGNTEEDNEVPHYLNMAQTKDVVVSPNKFVSLRWDTVWTDTAQIAHHDGLAVVTKPCDLNGALWLEISDLVEGDDVQVRMADWERKTKKYRLHPIAEGIGTGGKSFPSFSIVNRIADGYTMDLRVYNVSEKPFTLHTATFKGHVWLR